MEVLTREPVNSGILRLKCECCGLDWTEEGQVEVPAGFNPPVRPSPACCEQCKEKHDE